MPTHLEEARRAWTVLEKAKKSERVVLNGENGSLELAHIVAVARCVLPKGLSQHAKSEY